MSSDATMTLENPLVTRVVNQDMAANTYLYRLPDSSGCVVVDPGLDRQAIDEALTMTGLTPLAIFLTHGHFDHVGSAEHLSRRFDIDVHLHDADVDIVRASNFTMMALKMSTRIEVPTRRVPIVEGNAWVRGSARIDFLHVPGHTPGSVAILADGMAFTGDTLYRNDVLPGTLPGSDDDRLAESLKRLWSELPEDLMVYPGHGQPATFGEIRLSNRPLRALVGAEDTAKVPQA